MTVTVAGPMLWQGQKLHLTSDPSWLLKSSVVWPAKGVERDQGTVRKGTGEVPRPEEASRDMHGVKTWRLPTVA